MESLESQLQQLNNDEDINNLDSISNENNTESNPANEVEAESNTESELDENNEALVSHNDDAIIPEIVHEVNNSNLSKEAKEEIVSMIRVFSGPLPPANEFAEYDKVCPGAAKSILDMAMSQQSHDHEMEKIEAERHFEITKQQTKNNERYYDYVHRSLDLMNIRTYAFTIIALALISGMIVCVILGKDTKYFTPFVVGLGTLALALIFGKAQSSNSDTGENIQNNNQENDQKSDQEKQQ